MPSEKVSTSFKKIDSRRAQIVVEKNGEVHTVNVQTVSDKFISALNEARIKAAQVS